MKQHTDKKMNETDVLVSNIVSIFKTVKEQHPVLIDDIDVISENFEKLRTDRNYIRLNDYLQDTANNILHSNSEELIAREDALVTIFNSIRVQHNDYISRESDKLINTCIRKLKTGQTDFSDACNLMEEIIKEIAVAVSKLLTESAEANPSVIPLQADSRIDEAATQLLQTDVIEAVDKAKNDLHALTTILCNQNPNNSEAVELKKQALSLKPNPKGEYLIETMDLVSKNSWLTNKIYEVRIKKDKAYLHEIGKKFKEISATFSNDSEINSSQKDSLNALDGKISEQVNDIEQDANDASNIDSLKERVLNRASKIKNKLSSFVSEQKVIISQQEKTIKDQKKYCEEVTQRIESMQKELEHTLKMASFDRLTGIHNRNGYDEKSLELNELWRTKKQSIGLLVVDIDHFKGVNDTYGHDVGDEVLQFIGTIFKGVAKLYTKSFCARYGGEEFVVSIQDTKHDDVVKIAHRISKTLQQNPFKSDEDKFTIPLTVSIGISFFHNERDTANTVFSYADKALYKAKEKRNAICVYNRDKGIS